MMFDYFKRHPFTRIPASSLCCKATIIGALSFFILFIGLGRIFSLTLHDPLLGYANSYEMIQLQACHQIWPADAGIDITRGTPTAPLRNYTLHKHVDTPCLSSSELVFTYLGIKLANIQNHFNGGDAISLQTIGFVKAAFLSLTALLAQIYFLKRNHNSALFIHALSLLVVLSDPGITLYLNTFYTEFSAVYFLYLALLGIAVIGIEYTSAKNISSTWRIFYALPLIIGILGFGFSKSQHAPVLLCMGLLLAIYFFIYTNRWLALILTLCIFTPYALEKMELFSPSNENIPTANKINVMGSALGIAKDPKQLLKDMDLPESCLALAGKNWYAPIVQKNKICFEVINLSHAKIACTLMTYPDVISGLIWAGLPRLQVWVFSLYGQVESERRASVDTYYWSISALLKPLSQGAFFFLLVFPTGLACTALLLSLFRKNNSTAVSSWSKFLLLSLLPLAFFTEALLRSGFVDLGKNTHLVVPLTLFVYILLLSILGSSMVEKICNKPHNPNPGE